MFMEKCILPHHECSSAARETNYQIAELGNGRFKAVEELLRTCSICSEHCDLSRIRNPVYSGFDTSLKLDDVDHQPGEICQNHVCAFAEWDANNKWDKMEEHFIWAPHFTEEWKDDDYIKSGRILTGQASSNTKFKSGSFFGEMIDEDMIKCVGCAGGFRWLSDLWKNSGKKSKRLDGKYQSQLGNNEEMDEPLWPIDNNSIYSNNKTCLKVACHYLHFSCLHKYGAIHRWDKRHFSYYPALLEAYTQCFHAGSLCDLHNKSTSNEERYLIEQENAAILLSKMRKQKEELLFFIFILYIFRKK
eukprot:GHVL01021083.1.p1 GENE.GHVL01021083.1~~GHVL01021083.1.p1  ORF type:complete len:303 (+),score=45.69 GHVL01021083.1:544-1452(+)